MKVLISSIVVVAAATLAACSSTPNDQSSSAEADLSNEATACAHPRCSTGRRLSASCDSCVAEICKQDSYCCSQSWDSQCVSEVGSICGQSCGTAACAHPACVAGGALVSSCDPCVAKVCANDSYCCATRWDDQCVGEVPQYCGQSCAADAGAPDSSTPDASTPDASAADAGVSDSSVPDSSPPSDAGTGPGNGGIGANGGKLTSLEFGIVGDTRPSAIDDTAGYPSDVITGIYGDIAALTPAVPFVVSTGDYNFSSSNGPESANQFDLYLQARAKYAGAWFPTMGNHECTGYTSSNCGSGNSDGVTTIYSNYLSQLLGPIGKTLPYYVIRVDAVDGSWTSKLVFVAANAWTTAQGTWLDQQLAVPTTYTFIVRHEAASANTAPGVDPSEQIMAKHPYTLSIVGHSHTYSHSGRELLVGNGGAPLSDSVSFGYALVRQRASDAAMVVDMFDYQSNNADSAFHFAVKPDGSPAAP